MRAKASASEDSNGDCAFLCGHLQQRRNRLQVARGGNALNHCQQLSQERLLLDSAV
jgi:hypothetical protein